jgi:hypothetical protein
MEKEDKKSIKQFKRGLEDVKAERIKEVKTEYLKRLDKIRKGKFVKYCSIDDLKKSVSY